MLSPILCSSPLVIYQHRQLFRSCVNHFAQRRHSRICTATRETRRNIKFKMAKRRILEVDYAQLNNFSSVVLYNNPPRRQQKTLPGSYSVERIISRRSINNVSKLTATIVNLNVLFNIYCLVTLSTVTIYNL